MSRFGHGRNGDRFYCDVPGCGAAAASNADLPRGWLAVEGSTTAPGGPWKIDTFPRSALGLHLCPKCKRLTRHDLGVRGFIMDDGRQAWEIWRQARPGAEMRLVFRGPEGEARRKYESAAEGLRQGVLQLRQPNLIIDSETSAPTLRTRW